MKNNRKNLPNPVGGSAISVLIIVLFIISSPTVLEITQSAIINNIMIPFLFGFIIFTYVIVQKVRVSVRSFVILISFIVLLLITVSINQSSGYFSDLKHITTNYVCLVVMLLLLFLRPTLNVYDSLLLFKGVVGFGVIESILGICQFILKKPLIPIDYHGNPVVSSIYYIPGQGGTGDVAALTGNYMIRAFGTMGSGLGLGILVLMSLAIVQTWKPTKNVLLLKIFFSLTVLATLTTTIIIGLFVYFFVVLIIKLRKQLLSFMFYGLWFMGISTQIVLASLPQSFLDLVPTLMSRFDGIRYYYSVLHFSVVNTLFGQNFSNRWLSLANATTNINGRYVVDNFYMYVFYDLGLLGLLIIFLAHRNIFKMLLDKNNISFISLNLSLLVIGFANNISYAIGIFGVVSLFATTQSFVKSSRQERKKSYEQ